MSKKSSIMLVLLSLMVCMSQTYGSEQEDIDKKLSYALGYQQALNEKDSMHSLDLKAFYEGFKAGYIDKKPLFSEAEMNIALENYYLNAKKKTLKDLEEKANINLKLANKFLTQNKTKIGVHTTKSGLQYEVISVGKGGSPTLTDTVKVSYEGKLIDGRIFDSSYEQGRIAEFQMDEVIKGFTEGLKLMKKGARYKLYIPPELGYGENSNTGIEPNSLMIFTIELIDFKPTI